MTINDGFVSSKKSRRARELLEKQLFFGILFDCFAIAHKRIAVDTPCSCQQVPPTSASTLVFV